MRYCPSCNIRIEGAHKQCPLCQNGLSGEPEAGVYPSAQEFRKKSQLYKIQLFVLITLMLISVVLDFALDIYGSFHWSLIVVAWVILGERMLTKLIHRHGNPSFVVAYSSAGSAILIFITFFLIGHTSFFLAWILPSMAMACEVLLFVFMMSDKSQNAMIYLLGSSFIYVVGAVVYMMAMKEKSILWLILCLVSVIGVVGAVIFKEKRVTSELHKRFHI